MFEIFCTDKSSLHFKNPQTAHKTLYICAAKD